MNHDLVETFGPTVLLAVCFGALRAFSGGCGWKGRRNYVEDSISGITGEHLESAVATQENDVWTLIQKLQRDIKKRRSRDRDKTWWESYVSGSSDSLDTSSPSVYRRQPAAPCEIVFSGEKKWERDSWRRKDQRWQNERSRGKRSILLSSRPKMKERSYRFKPQPSLPNVVNRDRLALDDLEGKVIVGDAQEKLHRNEMQRNLDDIERLKRQLSAANRQNRSCRRKEENQMKENDRLRGMITDMEGRLSVAERNIAKKEAAANDLQQKLRQAEDNNRQMRKKFEGQEQEIRKGRSVGDDLRRQVQEANALVAKLRQDNEMMRCELSQKEKEVRRMKSNWNKDGADAKQLKAELAQKNAVINKLEADRGRLENEYEVLRNNFSVMKAHFQNHKNEKDKIAAQLSILVHGRGEDEESLRDLDQRLDSLLKVYRQYQQKERSPILPSAIARIRRRYQGSCQ
ncbi:golgin subfamily A member 6-like protein 25 [Macrobrachium nipponense]|uniref:golgin subfamily A member 6-like protein 25 n=1 Tax=Macrobrachium nipponense TaxID=159736 RepID=UPI0030C7DC45